jgi:hypothetical protein
VSLDLEIARRNARFRAWRAYGLAFEGGWYTYPSERHGYSARLDLRCLACLRLVRSRFVHKGNPPSVLQRREEDATDTASGRAGIPLRGYCSHLSPLLGEDPPEVRAIWEMEILSGG